MLNLNTIWTELDYYPVNSVDSRLAALIRHFSEQLGAPCELTGPVVLAAISAATQAHVDIVTPYGVTTSIGTYTLITAGSGLRKTESKKRILQSFDEIVDVGCSHSSNIPILLENATEGGIQDTFINGAYSVFFAHDEASKFLRRADITAMCKRFDGGTIRYTSRENYNVVLADRKTSMCLFIQDGPLDRLMEDKGDDLIESGLFPRMLISFATLRAQQIHRYTPTTSFYESPDEKWFHDRIRNLNDTYRTALHQGAPGRISLFLNKEADEAWRLFTKALDQSCATWEDIDPFAGRAGGLVLRIAAALQWFFEPKTYVELWAIHSARSIVGWHLREVKRHFGVPPREIQMLTYSSMLHDFLLRRYMQEGKVEWTRSGLLREAPKQLRDSDILSMALAPLLQGGILYVQRKTRSDIFIFNTLSYFHQPAQIG